MTAFQNIRDAGLVLGGLWGFYRSGRHSKRAWRGALHAHCRTNGRSTRYLAGLLRMIKPKARLEPVTGLLGELSVAAQHRIAQTLAREGFYIFERRIPPELCDEIERFAATTPASIEGRGTTPAERIVYDPGHPVSRTYRLSEDDIVANPGVQQLMGDPSILAVANAYLPIAPMLARVNVWWSAPTDQGPGDDAAQLFHFDFDAPPAWLKIFVYLSDVDANSGPHVFVRGSHVPDHPAAAALRRRGYVRISDAEIDAAFGRENVVELVGRRGTVLAVDTRGFHKGKEPISGRRLLVQLVYATPPLSEALESRFPLPAKVNAVLAEACRRWPDVYARYRRKAG